MGGEEDFITALAEGGKGGEVDGFVTNEEGDPGEDGLVDDECIERKSHS